MKKFLVILIFMAVLSVGYSNDSNKPLAVKSELRLYLPREVVVKSELVELGSVAIMQGDESLMMQAKGVGLGKFVVASQRIILDRNTILSRLASEGISSSKVTLSGAEEVTVKRLQKTIESQRFAEIAREFLAKQLAGNNVSKMEPVRMPAEWVTTQSGQEVELVASMGKYSGQRRDRVWVAVMCDGVEIDGREVKFALKYNRQRAVAMNDIAKGMVLGAGNVKIETFESNSPDRANWQAPYGQVAKRAMKKDDVISDNMTAPFKPPVVIKRRQVVMAKIETGGLYISALGEAVSEGGVGDFIRVKMGTERDARIIYAQVQADGTVRPVF